MLKEADGGIFGRPLSIRAQLFGISAELFIKVKMDRRAQKQTLKSPLH